MRIIDLKECFYQPGKPGIIDAVHPNTRKGVYGGHTLEETQREYPGAELGDMDTVVSQQDDFWRRAPVEITEERWMEMLGVLPPVGWEHGPGGEVFKLSERTSGNITAIFCRLGNRFFEMQDSIFMDTGEILAKCQTVE